MQRYTRFYPPNGEISMKICSTLIIVTTMAALLLVVCPIQAQSGDGQNILYQTAFSTDPHWTTNNPRSDYWDPNKGMYHFGIEPSTGNYAWVPVEYDGGSFTLEYDLILEQVDDGATFRLGFSGTEMDRGKGPNVITEFTTTKYGRIMQLHMVNQNAKLMDVTSESSSYNGPTVTYGLNTTYHVMVIYDDNIKTLTERVTEKMTGKPVWSYYLNTLDPLKFMNRIYIGSVGDYGVTNKYAVGYIDNVRLYTPAPVTETPTIAVSQQPTSPLYTPHPTTRKPTTVPTTSPTPTPKSSPSIIVACAAFGIISAAAGMSKMRKNR
jgi:hypothetical protein